MEPCKWSPQNINTTAQDAMDNQQSLEAIKALLCDAEDDYAHAIAMGDWVKVTTAKRQVAEYRRVVARMIKEQMGIGI